MEDSSTTNLMFWYNSNSSFLEMNELDLHGFTHDEAVFASEDFVLQQSQNSMFQCRIIVGNSSQMTNRVTDMLDRHDFKYYIPSWNVGEIIVSN